MTFYLYRYIVILSDKEISRMAGGRKMTKFTQKQLREMVLNGMAEDISTGTNETRNEIESVEGWLTQVGYASGVYGCNGMLFKGHNSGKLYAITSRTQAIYIFG